nr:hypothetical protein CFP56_24304 [Quercus suber]
MLDYVGLLSSGNEEMLRFAWKTFAQWQMRTEDTEEERKAKNEQFRFMKKFRDTFSRFVTLVLGCRLRFAKADLRKGLLTESVSLAYLTASILYLSLSLLGCAAHGFHTLPSRQRESFGMQSQSTKEEQSSDKISLEPIPAMKRPHSDHMFRRKNPRHADPNLHADPPRSSAASQVSVNSTTAATELRQGHGDHDPNLDMGPSSQHGDIGGGWPLGKDETRPASDLPLIWMIREARLAGLPFDEDKLEASGLLAGEMAREADAPLLRLDGMPLPRTNSIEPSPMLNSDEDWALLETKTKLHDSLALGGGLSWTAVLAWNMMEWLPLRRMDLKPGGDWAPISWPLPRGEVRDMPHNAIIHGSAIRRMEADKSYRPGNLIIGGGGRGVRRAPESAGIGHWQPCHEEGHRIGGAVRRVPKTENS